jgi:glycosyltransferase involved in cell wall biosynthesis
LRRFPEAPFLYVPHSLVAPLEVENMGWSSALQRWISARVFHRLELLALNQALYTIRFTNTGCDALRAYYGKSVDPRFVVLPTPVTIPEMAPAHRINDPPQLLFVGRLVETKNVAWLIRCLYGLKDLPWNLSIVGDGEQRQTLEALSRDCALSDRIVFHGHQDDVAPFYRQADLFVFPSRLENSPIVLLEAMSYGVPTLSIRADGKRYLNANHEIITADHDGFVADNEEDFAAKLRGLLTSPERLHTVGKQARQTVEKRNQWSDHISSYERIFEGIQSRPRKNQPKQALEASPC